ncbi:sugar transporter SWEET1-like isoform X1 [Dreissena polymorpha]|nr:sugar transporter SWEET1-like isoform X1 [Dreissena polymorpha]XP_052267270.1 sugar transporter SWEET1-like isoform X1 [Dreissena polymorpha]XP_052267271.1 sugar transporter SWEET1-like isoform X1 [Dreissena polymorpha]
MDLTTIVGMLCSMSSFSFQLVGINVCRGIVKKGSTGDMSPFTFISYFVACAVWLKYGLIVQNTVVIATNSFGSIMNFIYIIVFYTYSSKKPQFNQFLFLGAVMIVSPLVYIKHFQTDGQLALSHLGSYCVCLTIIGYGAPLVSLSDIVRSKSTESLHFVLILANFLLGLLWTLYGLLIADRYVQVPNFLGAMLALIQLSLFAIYPRSSHSRSKVIHS